MKLANVLRALLVAGALALFTAPWACGDDTTAATDGGTDTTSDTAGEGGGG